MTTLTIEEVSQEIAGQTNLYYQKQLRLQKHFREQLEAQEKYVASMRTSSEMHLTTVNDILDLSKLDSGKMKFFIAPFNPASVIEQVLNSLSGKALFSHL